MEKLKVPKVS